MRSKWVKRALPAERLALSPAASSLSLRATGMAAWSRALHRA